MKALSLLQPWASLIAIGAKRVETRAWGTDYRGEVAIHASKAFPLGTRLECHRQPFAGALGAAGFNAPGDLPLGAIVAVARLVYVVPTENIVQYADFTEQERAFGDYYPGRKAWRLSHVRPLKTPVPCRGSLGLWDVPADLRARIEAAL